MAASFGPRSALTSSRPAPDLPTHASLLAAARLLHESGAPAVGIGGGSLVLDSEAVRRALAEGARLEDAALPHAYPPLTLPWNATAPEALRQMDREGVGWAALAREEGRVEALVEALPLLADLRMAEPPRKIGGMATPLGVYFTDGQTGGGVRPLALVLTGASLLGLFLGAGVIELVLRNLLWPMAIREPWYTDAADAMIALLFLIFLRLTPIAGIHGAEHKVVHAVELGEPLTPEVVARMPREHPRCGTNLAVGAMILFAVARLTIGLGLEAGIMLGLLAAFLLWRPLGMAAQRWFTTKEPSRSQIERAIVSAESLLGRVRQRGRSRPTVGRWLLSSGILHIAAGSLLAQAVVLALQELLRLPDAWRVLSFV